MAMSFGKFQGEVVAKWSRDPPLEARIMFLMADFTYSEPTRPPTVWPAPKGRWIDGASIPEFLWSLACLSRQATDIGSGSLHVLSRDALRSYTRPFSKNYVSRCPHFWPSMGRRTLTRTANARKHSTVSSKYYGFAV